MEDGEAQGGEGKRRVTGTWFLVTLRGYQLRSQRSQRPVYLQDISDLDNSDVRTSRFGKGTF